MTSSKEEAGQPLQESGEDSGREGRERVEDTGTKPEKPDLVLRSGW